MKITKITAGGILTPKGFTGSAGVAGIKNPEATRYDVGLIYSEKECNAAGTFTTNQVKAAPVTLSEKNISNGKLKAIIANSGNANACTGKTGEDDALAIIGELAKELKITSNDVAICSTGVIGIPLPLDRVLHPISSMVSSLSKENGTQIAHSIMTSDTCHKEIAIKCISKEGLEFSIGSCAKGAGMICPNMATMLSFITTDLNISSALLKTALKEAVDASFNCITIDGDMSTNDTVLILANGAVENTLIDDINSPLYQDFLIALKQVTLEMAQALVQDGERVTKFVTVNVQNALTKRDAMLVAQAVANSSLVKASWNGEDPNWGRVIHAVGYSSATLDPSKITISYNDTIACKNGLQADVDMEKLREIVTADSYTITIDLSLGNVEHKVYSSDLSPEYVDFNRSEYAYWKQAKLDGLA